MNAPNQKTGFFEELKRRNVVRVGVAYLVTAWLVLQVADIVLENIEAPLWIMQAFMLFLAVCLPIALIFAWAFELTPDGLKREKDVDRSQSITPKTGRKLDFMIIGIMAAVIVLLLVDRFTGSESVGGSLAADSEGRERGSLLQKGAESADVEGSLAADKASPSIAVLPFVNMSSDPEQEFFSDGISEEILNALAKVKELKVAGRTSSFAFKGKDQDLRQIGLALGVAHILEGSVRKSGDTVRITAQLIQVDDGFHLWSDTYDRELTNVFAIQDEIATAILEQMKAHLVGMDKSSTIDVAQRTDPVAYEQYLLAKQRLYERKRLSIESAADLLDQAIAKDPAYAPAYAQRGIAALLLSDRNYGEMTLAEADAQGKLYLDKALQLDPQLAEAWAGIGLYHVNRPTEQRQGLEALEKALSINPNLIDASNWLQIGYLETGDAVRSREILEDMVERDPLFPPAFGNAVGSYNRFGLQDKSWALIERVRPFLPGDPQVMHAEAVTWMSLGQPSKALPLLEAALATQPSNGVMRIALGWSLMHTGQFERMAEEGLPFQKAVALNVLNRPEEAMMIVQELAEQGLIGGLLGQLDRTGRHRELIEFVESRWADLAAFEREYPDGGDGYSIMLHIARAYSLTGNEARFEDAMARVRAANDRALAQGIKDPYLLMHDARYYIMAGDPERAKQLLAQAVDSGMLLGARLDLVWGEMAMLAGDPEFEAIQARMDERTNAERAAVGLEALST